MSDRFFLMNDEEAFKWLIESELDFSIIKIDDEFVVGCSCGFDTGLRTHLSECCKEFFGHINRDEVN